MKLLFTKQTTNDILFYAEIVKTIFEEKFVVGEAHKEECLKYQTTLCRRLFPQNEDKNKVTMFKKVGTKNLPVENEKCTEKV